MLNGSFRARSRSLAIAGLIAAAAPLLERGPAKVSNPAVVRYDIPPPRPRETKDQAALRREIAAWNAAVDAKKAAKRRGSL